MNEIFSFPPGKHGQSEWPGTQIGIANTITRIRTRLPRVESFADPMLTLARRALEGRESYINDIVVGRRRARCFSNSHHLGDFWRESGWSASEWRALTGKIVPDAPAIVAHAAIDVPDCGEAAALSKDPPAAFAFNTSYFGELRALLMEAMGAIPAAGVWVGGKGVLMVGGSDKISVALGLLEQPGSIFLSDDAVFVEIDGGKTCAWRAEKRSYMRADLIAAFPELAWEFLRSRFENVPDISDAFLSQNVGHLEALASSILSSSNQAALNYFGAMSPDSLRRLLARMTAFEGTRVLMNPAGAFGPKRVFGPLEPMRVDAVFVLRRDSTDTTVLEELAPERFRALAGFEIAALAGVPLYSLNAIFDRDPANRSWRQSIIAAGQLITRTLDRGSAPKLTLSTYRS